LVLLQSTILLPDADALLLLLQEIPFATLLASDAVTAWMAPPRNLATVASIHAAILRNPPRILFSKATLRNKSWGKVDKFALAKLIHKELVNITNLSLEC
jgi:hypothetical protein